MVFLGDVSNSNINLYFGSTESKEACYEVLQSVVAMYLTTTDLSSILLQFQCERKVAVEDHMTLPHRLDKMIRTIDANPHPPHRHHQKLTDLITILQRFQTDYTRCAHGLRRDFLKYRRQNTQLSNQYSLVSVLAGMGILTASYVTTNNNDNNNVTEESNSGGVNFFGSTLGWILTVTGVGIVTTQLTKLFIRHRSIEYLRKIKRELREINVALKAMNGFVEEVTDIMERQNGPNYNTASNNNRNESLESLRNLKAAEFLTEFEKDEEDYDE